MVNAIEIFRPTRKNLRKCIKKTTIHNDENKMSFEIHYGFTTSQARGTGPKTLFRWIFARKILAFLGRWDSLKQLPLQQVANGQWPINRLRKLTKENYLLRIAHKLSVKIIVEYFDVTGVDAKVGLFQVTDLLKLL